MRASQLPRAEQLTATPYVDALRAYADAAPTRLNVPGHKGRRRAVDPLAQLLGDEVLRYDVPPLLRGVDTGPAPHARQRAEALAAEAWGARETFFLTNGASQGNVACCLAAGTLGGALVAQRNVHSSVVDGLVLSGLRPRWVAPELDPAVGSTTSLRD